MEYAIFRIVTVNLGWNYFEHRQSTQGHVYHVRIVMDTQYLAVSLNMNA